MLRQPSALTQLPELPDDSAILEDSVVSQNMEVIDAAEDVDDKENGVLVLAESPSLSMTDSPDLDTLN